MRVRAPYGARPPVEHKAHGALLARALGVEVHKDNLLLYLRHVPVGNDEGVVGVGVEREAPEQVEHAHIPERRGVDIDALAGALRTEVRRAQYAPPLVEIGAQLRARPRVVAQRHHVRPGAQQRVRLLGRDADDVRVFTVDDGEGDVLFALVVAQTRGQKIQSGLAAHIAHGEDLNAHSLSSV